ncbi:Cytosine/adenosine deaminase [Andreprevotia lacus DSM 23236]|jgi:5-methylthioadenosine/S-adenosylhomocysteine deaminase|uniref:5-methylthioadenosine/S-adenosylhomocysteine deaminase n=1 Tax=Andreprevotia lacus DSM 23236 TaxID=1121001 RepID=A0A1W1XNX5_9NEIS|nr:TRZ/ATZ family hydrolase [Andreprevotia lacus]SMC25690.1 Cytosine/adenosine deaminase [Andreprevotia lacus DSM 23236]
MPRITLVQPRWLLQIESRNVLTGHALVMQDDRIAAILPQADAHTAWPDAAVVNLPDHALMPGLVNLHAHSAMTLLRGYADDLALMTWLNEHIWPAEGKHVSDEFVYDGTQLAIAEMIRGGTTCANDMYFHHGAVARAAIASGFRIMVGCSILEFPTPYASGADAYIQKALACIDEFRGEPLVGFTLAPHAPYTVSDATFGRVITLADELGIGIHCHIHETQDEIAGSLKEHGVRPLERLAGLGLLSGQLVAAHMVHMTDAEIALVAKRGVHIAHNPASNLKLASGFARVTDQLTAGINVGIGTDGAASNNKLDMFAELRLAALLAKGQSGNPEALPAWQALEMATLGGARALGWDDRIGTLEAGKAADMIAVDLSALGTQPCFDPVSHLVYALDRQQVSHVWINGELQLADGELTRIKLPQVAARARHWQQRIAG